MKNKQFNKTLIGKTGKDLLGMVNVAQKHPQKQAIIAPREETEITIYGFWKSLLGHDIFGVNDNFFEVGGNSLKAIQLLSRISAHYLVQVSLTDIFLHPTIAQIALLIPGKQNGKLSGCLMKVKERPAYIPLSFNQERLWFIDQLEGSVQYHIPAVLRLKGKLNKDALAYAFAQIINRHEVLRTLICEEAGLGHQFIQDQNKWQLSFNDGSAYQKDVTGLRQYIQQLIKQPFDLSKDYMMRAELISIADEENVLVITLHHIASDGWSTAIIIKELVALYKAFETGVAANLEPLSVQYADFSIWQREYMHGQVLAAKLDYWKTKLDGATPLQLPTDHARSAVQSFNGGVCEFTIDIELTELLHSLSRQQGVTLFMVLLAAFKVLLHRYSGQQDITIGTAMAGRQQQELEGLIGFFVNTLALRSHVDNSLSFIDLLKQVKTTTLEAFENQQVPFEKVVEAVVKERDMSRSPLFQVMFVLQNTPDKETIELGEVTLSEESFESDKAKFELDFSLTETPEGLQGSVGYCTDLYDEQTIQRMIGHFNELLNSVVKIPQQAIGLLPILGIREKQQLTVDFNDTQSAYPEDKNIVSLFEEQVLKTPEAVAVVFEKEILTYKELNERSNQLAAYLLEKGVGTETLVPVCMDRSPGLIITILAILKAGGAYVPLDVDYPAERIRFMLEDTGASLIIASKKSSVKLPVTAGVEIIEIDGDHEKISLQSSANPRIGLKHNNLAYVIYTSGSTGKPKGVLVEQGNVVSLVKGVDFVSLTSEDILLSTGSPSFDASTIEYWGMLLNGGRLILCAEKKLLDSELLKEEIRKQNVNKMWFTSSWFNQLVECDLSVFEGLQTIMVGGEKLSEHHINKMCNRYPLMEIINGYGPTENTTFSLTYQINNSKPENPIPIGRPLNNRLAYILDAARQLVPVGVAGEILLGGAGLSRGYLNQPELTAERFITNPFNADPGARLYCTGDLGRWLPDGNIEYIGRLDEQVKIRGYRIELGEIESALQQSGLVSQSVVLAIENKERNSHHLVGYLVPNERFSREAITDYLRGNLPDYMIPGIWMEMENLPLTSNGKIDKKRLPDPPTTPFANNNAYAAPENELQRKLAGIWKDLLRVDRVGIHDNFFELGGDSILIIQVVSRIRRIGYKLQVSDIFTHQDIAGLSKVIQEKSGTSNVTGEQGFLEGASGLIPIQQWYFEKDPTAISHFNQSVLLGINKAITRAELLTAFEQLIVRHDALRFKYAQTEQGWQQVYGDRVNGFFSEDLQSASPQSLNELITARADKHQLGLNIQAGQLIRMVWLQTPDTENDNRLLIIVHHLAIDGVSWRILLEDLEWLLDQRGGQHQQAPGQKGTSYRQWYQAIEQYSKSMDLLSQEGYWKNIMESYIPLPIDKENSGAIKLGDLGNLTAILGAEHTRQLLQEVPRAYHTEMNDMLLTALAQTLCEWSGRDKITIGLEGHGREPIAEEIDTSRTVGWFTSLYPVVLEAGINNTDSDWIKAVKEQLRRVPNKGIGFGVLKYINKDPLLQTREPWDILFNYLGQLDNVLMESKWLDATGLIANAERGTDHIQSEKLSVTASIQAGEMVINWNYSKLHFEEDTIQKLIGQYLFHLKNLIAHCIGQQKYGMVHTPFDYGLASEISYHELDNFLDGPFNGSSRRENLEGLYRLSSLQQGMLFHRLYDGEAGTYMNQVCIDLINPDPAIISKSWNNILHNHSILRSAFYYDAFSVPVQCVYKNVALAVEMLDIEGMNNTEQQAAIDQYEMDDRMKGFDFKVPPLMRIRLIRLSADRYRMIWTAHHILFDGWSLPILMEEFLTTYETYLSGGEMRPVEQDLYEDYIRYIERGNKAKEEIYWRNYLQGLEHASLLPFIALTKERTKGVGEYKIVALHLDALTVSGVQNFTQTHHLTINTLIQGVWAFLLHRYTGNSNVMYGVIVSGRPDDLPNVEQRVGMYINTLPLHSIMNDEKNVAEWLQHLQGTQVASRQYQHTALQDIQGWLGIQGDFFDSLLVFQNYPVNKLLSSRHWGLQVENVLVNEQNNFPLTITIGSGELKSISLTYNTGLLSSEYVHEIRDHIGHVLEQMVTGENVRLGDITLVTAVEEHQLLAKFNETKAGSLVEKNVIALFEEQVLKTPLAIALIFEEEEISFLKLNELSNQLAHFLVSRGVRENVLVPLCLHPSVEMVVGILGVLKAGGAYVPVEPGYPAERISFMLEDTGAKIVLANAASSSKVSAISDIDVIEIDPLLGVYNNAPSVNLQKDIQPGHLAYVIYTSGSSGKPKGVLIEHGNLVNYLLNEKTKYSTDQPGNSGSFIHLSFTFDASLTGIFMPLLSGKSIVIGSKKSINAFEDSNLKKYAPYDFIKITPAHLELLEHTTGNAHGQWLTKKLVIGGEALHIKQFNHFIEAGISIDIVNEYGPTEATVGCSTYCFNILHDHDKLTEGIPIGKPLDYVQMYILDENLRLLPPGITGEICIGGDGIARGYLNRPELTAEKFINDPFGNKMGARLYRTGDLGRWLPDGNIEYLGRKDDQVKIRGYRVELGEIEMVLQQSHLVKNAVVLAREDNEGNKRLIAYIVADGVFDKDAITSFLGEKLPEYMVPGLWVNLESLPLTSNGKIDRKALPDPLPGDLVNTAFMAPRNETEEKLIAIWKELLDIDDLGIHDDFFDLGGHSLLAIRAISAIRKQLEVELMINDVFDYPTVALLAAHLQGQSGTSMVPAIGIQQRPLHIPLSFSQERLWFIDQLEGSLQYHVPFVLRLKGKLETDALEYAFQNILERHSVLRTTFHQQDGLAYQSIIEKEGWRLSIVEGADFKENSEELGQLKEQLISRPFDLSKDYMLRAALIQLDDQDHLLVVTLHHIASDGWSTSVFVKEMVELYGSFKERRPVNLKPLPIQYADFAIWQHQYLQGEVLNNKLDYWKKKLDEVAPLQLPADFPRPPVWSTNGATIPFEIDKEILLKLQEISQQKSSTLFITLLAAFKVLLYRYSGQQDICVGTPIAGRQQQELEGLIGFFLNTLAVRSLVNGDSTFIELLQQVRATMLEAHEHQEVPFEKIVNAVVKERDLGRSPLFQVMFLLDNAMDAGEMKVGELILTTEKHKYTKTKFDLTFNLTANSQGLQGEVEYCTDLFSKQTIAGMIGHFQQLLASIVKMPQQKIGELQMLSQDEEQYLLVDLNNTNVYYPADSTIVDLFEEQVGKTPLAIAAVFGEDQLTYQQLNERSNQLAHYLMGLGIKEEMLVAVCLERSFEMIIGIWGILKAGAAYVPIDPEYPAERISYMLQDTKSTIVLSDQQSKSKLPLSGLFDMIDLGADWAVIEHQPVNNPRVFIKPHHLAYVIYTSGSTGKPKGAINEHRGIINRLRWAQDYFKLTSQDSVLQKTTYCFDVSVWELLWPSIAGARLVFAKPGEHKDNEYLRSIIERQHITMVHFVPSMLEVFLSDLVTGDCTGLKKVLCSGEALKESQAELFKEKLPNTELHNLYGPTEAAIDVTCWSLSNQKAAVTIVPIGKPVANTSIYVLDAANKLMPMGARGELHIGGIQVGRGYLNREELTEQKFIADPFSKTAGARMYKTGDLASWLPDGNLQYLGRIDDQVKIRGFRIELGEIESVLQQSELVRQAVVLAKEYNGNKRLMGYIVPEGLFNKAAISDYLKGKLPEYMVPSVWIELKSLPLSANGKIDKKALPDPELGQLVTNEYVAPRNEVEKMLADIWKELLHVEQVGIYDNFFELGGDSIITIQVVSRARRSGFILQTKDLFIHQTIAKLSAAVTGQPGAEVLGEQGLLIGSSGLLPIQQWYFESELIDTSHFNQSVLLGIEKSVLESELSEAVKQLTARHDALRFSYHQVDGKWEQQYGSVQVQIITEDLATAPQSSLASLIQNNADKHQRSLDIEKGELMRVVWMQTPDSEVQNRLLIIVHHQAIDGVSWRILLEDMDHFLSDFRNGEKLDTGFKGSSYRQWYKELEAYGQTSRLLSQTDYWKMVVNGYQTFFGEIELPGKPTVKDLGHQTARLNAAQTRSLIQEVSRTYHTEINDMLISALSRTLCEWSNRQQVVIGLEGHGREDIAEGIDISRTVGWFTSLYPVMLNGCVGEEEAGLIKTVKEQLRQVKDKGVGFGVLKYINKEESLQGIEPWDIIFNYLGQLDNVVGESKWFEIVNESAGKNISGDQYVKEKISINCFVQDGELIFNWIYSKLHLQEDTVKELAEKYLVNLESIIAHCVQKNGVKEIGYTPSDFGLASEITHQELDSFLDEQLSNDKIRRNNIDGLYPLSGLQQGMLFHGLYDAEAGIYIDQFGCDLLNVNLEYLKLSWNYLLKGHSILRSAFYYDTFSVPVQCAYTDVEIPIEVLDYRGLNNAEQLLALKEYEEADRVKGFDFKTPPLMRLALIRLTDDRCRMLWTWHHILLDGWSKPILISEFLNAYELLSEGKELAPGKDDRYEDFIRYVERSNKELEEKYWRKYMTGVEQSTLLPFIGKSLVRNKGVGESSAMHLLVDDNMTVKIHRYAQQHRITANTIMQGVWACLLHRYTGNNDIVFGVIVSGRPDDLPGVEQRVGMYINTMALHTRIKKERGIVDWLKQIQEEQVASRQYQHTSINNIQSWTGVQGDLFDSLLVFQNYPFSEVITSQSWKLQVENIFVQEQNNLPLTITVTVLGQISIEFRYDTALLAEKNVREIMGHFEEALQQLINNPEGIVSEIELLSQQEQHELLFDFNDSTVTHPGKSIVDLFEEQVEKTPGNVAVVFEEEQLSYQQLNERSNQLAWFLKSKGVKVESLVPICIERGLDMMIGILGILKAGGAYVPVDVDFPQDRINFMLEDTGSSLLVSSKESRSKLEMQADIEVIEIDGDWAVIKQYPVTNLNSGVAPHNLAYVIYTSGSTGKPKGVMIEHSSLVDYYYGLNNRTQIGQCRSFALVSTIATDLGNTGIFSSLLSGGALHIFSKATVSDTELLHRYFRQHSIDCLKIVPSHWKALAMEDRSLLPAKLLVFGGEALQTGLIEDIRLSGANCRVINHYGPTETTIGKLLHIVDPERTYGHTIPIGKPFSNTRVYVLSKELKLCPVGVPGQLYIAGDGVARGYLNNADLTNEKFIADPFNKESASKMYGTGDLVKYLRDGNIEFIGRVDDQVKIRGYRMEPGEIESVLQQCEIVSQAVVLAKDDKQGNKRLVAYVVADGWFDREEIASYLKSKLPDYMIPAIIVELESLPLTANGKIDRKALPDPDVAEGISDQYVAPRNEVEARLAEIWQDVLDLETVGIHDNFFELGGDSIISIQVVSRARRIGCQFQVADVFTYQTIAGLAEYLDHRSETLADVTNEQLLLSGAAGLLPVQQWYLEKQPVEISYFNQGVLLSIDKLISATILKTAVGQLAIHHDALRFRYQRMEGVWQQEYGTSEAELITVDLLSARPDNFGSLLAGHAEAIQRSLDIEQGKLVKFVLIRTPEFEVGNRLLMVVHHLAIDGVSWRVLLEDLEILLAKLKNDEPTDLGKKTSSYREWYDALVSYGQSNSLLSQKGYWEKAVSNYSPLPADKNHDGVIKQKDKQLHTSKLGAAQTRGLLKDVPRVYHTEINDILICAVSKTISGWSKNDKVLIGMEGHGREAIAEGIDTSRTVGWFTTHYPLLIEVGAAKTEGDLIKSVKEQLRKVPDKGIGYGVLKYINKDEALQGAQPWDIIFNYLGQLDNIVGKSKWLAAAVESAGADTSGEYTVSEKLWVNCYVRDEELVFNWTYSDKHFTEDTVQQLAAVYISNLESLIAHCKEQQSTGGAVYSPSDFALGTEISYPELDKFLEEPFNGKPRKESIEGMYRLSGLQEGMLFHALYDGKGEGYIIHIVCDLINPDVEILSKSWNHLVKGHSILRSAFYHDSFSIPVQCVYRELALPIEILDYRHLGEAQQNVAIQQLQEADRAIGFDFKAGLLMRISLIRLTDQRYRMIWSFHHILFDGWSRSIMMSRFLKTYELLLSGKALPPVAEDRYEDYIRYIERIDKEKEQAYWKNYLQSVEQPTLLPFIASTAERNKGVGLYRSIHLNMNEELTGQVERFAQGQRITMNTLMQGVWSYLLHCYTGNNDIVYGITVSGRPTDLPKVEQRVGLYINTLLLHSVLHPDDTIGEWLQSIQNDQLLSRQFEHTPLHIIQGWTGVQGDLFDSLITFENYPVSKLLASKQWGLEAENVQTYEQNNFPLTLIIGCNEQISIEFNYNSELLEEVYVHKISNHFEQVLLQMIDNGAGRVNDLKLLTKEEQQQVLIAFNDTSAPFPLHKTTVQLFEEQARKTPKAIAVVFESEELTYEELDARSNQLAHYLIAKGIQPGNNIGLLSQRGINMITGMFGILKTGCAYVPFNIDYPVERLNYIIENAGIKHIVFTDRELLESTGLEEYPSTGVEESLLSSTQPTRIYTGMDSCAYIMFTSGTTGNPKGIAVCHRNIIKLVYDQGEIAVESDDRVLQWSNYSFDGSVYDIYSSLLKGAGLYLIKDSFVSDANELSRIIKQQKITVCFITTALFNTLIDVEPMALKGLRKLLFGGEMVSLSHVRKALSILGPGKIIHVYGPTETTVYATWYCIDTIHENGIIPIGKPLSNTKLLVLNKEKELVPVGVTGELYIGGDGVSGGYVNNDALTEEKFVHLPLGDEQEVARFYKTGDMVRWLADGNIEFLGRLDQQVKIRGYRIELGEIESVLQQCNLVRQAVVLAREDKEGTKSLVGYVVPTEEFERDGLIAYLANKLPAYMVPSLWVELPHFPLTSNGKIDRKALPDPNATEGLKIEYAAPRTEVEQTLAEIWQELLDIERVGIHDNFFELGGHSLLAIRLISSVRRELKIELSINTFFELPTIEELANYIKVSQNNQQAILENYDTIKL